MIDLTGALAEGGSREEATAQCRIRRDPLSDARGAIEAAWKAERQHDWDGLLEAEDVRREVHRRLENHARVGGQANWWSMDWAEMTVVYTAALAELDVDKMKKTMRKLRKATDEWWRLTWQEWRASGLGVEAVNRGERKAVILEGWDAMRTLLGDEYRSASGRRMPSATAMSGRSWISIGAALKQWATNEAKGIATAAILRRPDGSEMQESIARAGVRLEHMEDESRPKTREEQAQAELHALRVWDVDKKPMKSAKTILEDRAATEESKQAAKAWQEASDKRLKAHPPRGAKHTNARRAKQIEARSSGTQQQAKRKRDNIPGGGGGQTTRSEDYDSGEDDGAVPDFVKEYRKNKAKASKRARTTGGGGGGAVMQPKAKKGGRIKKVGSKRARATAAVRALQQAAIERRRVSIEAADAREQRRAARAARNEDLQQRAKRRRSANGDAGDDHAATTDRASSSRVEVNPNFVRRLMRTRTSAASRNDRARPTMGGGGGGGPTPIAAAARTRGSRQTNKNRAQAAAAATKQQRTETQRNHVDNGARARTERSNTTSRTKNAGQGGGGVNPPDEKRRRR